MFCTTCGEKMEEGAVFCSNCGNAVEAKQTIAPEPTMNLNDSSTFSTASGQDLPYVVIQVTLKEKFLGTGSGNLIELEMVINEQAKKGYRLHTIATSNGGSKGLMGGDRIQATLVFEKIV